MSVTLRAAGRWAHAPPDAFPWLIKVVTLLFVPAVLALLAVPIHLTATPWRWRWQAITFAAAALALSWFAFGGQLPRDPG